MIYQKWWKVLCVVILVYVIIAGMLVPLKPGVESISSARLESGSQSIVEVSGYNTHFSEANNTNRVWLKTGSDYNLAASNIEVINDTKIKLTFDLPQYLPSVARVEDASLIIDNEVDGAFVKPGAFSLYQENNDLEAGKLAWSQEKIEDLNMASGMHYPYRNILIETIRNLYFHVPMWFGMMILFLFSLVFSIRFLFQGNELDWDDRATAINQVGVLFGLLGLITGAIWAKHTWGAYWNFDVKQNTAAILVLIYSAYFVLRASIDDEEKKAKVSAVYNIFAFLSIIPLLFIIPRLTESLHPGSGGNPALGSDDLDNTMRMVFYPAVIGFTLLGFWIAAIKYRYLSLYRKKMELLLS